MFVSIHFHTYYDDLTYKLVTQLIKLLRNIPETYKHSIITIFV